MEKDHPTAKADPGMRRGACPTLAAPMMTGDGLLVRLRPAGTCLALDGLRALALGAQTHGNGILEITARGNVQIRGLTEQTLGPLAAAIAEAGIALSEGVAIETPPLAGLDPVEIANPLPLAQSLRAAIAARQPALRLAPKLSITIDGGGRFGLGTLSADLRLTAARYDGGIVWRLSVGGTEASARTLGWFDGSGAVEAAMAVLCELDARGPIARGRDLASSEAGTEFSRMRLHPPLSLRDISPTRGEIGHDFSASLPFEIAREKNNLPPCGGDVPEGQRGFGATDTNSREKNYPLPGLHHLADGTPVLSLAFTFGQATAADVLALVEMLQDASADGVRLAPGHGLLVTGLAKPQAEHAMHIAQTFGFVVSQDDPTSQIAVCAGHSACASGLTDTRAVARLMIETTPRLFDGSLSLHVSGCAKGCARPQSSALTLVGVPDGHALVVNGQAAGAADAYIDRGETHAAFSRLDRLIGENKGTDETVKACLVRLGTDRVARAVKQG